MATTFVLPSHIHASRIGVGESECDHSGELAPITWTCGCGSWMRLEITVTEKFWSSWLGDYDYDEKYVAVSDQQKNEFLSEHANCKPLCWKCRKVEVAFADGWCESCEQKEN